MSVHYNDKLISNNPFRILGVYSNASLKQITSNRSRISKFLSVGKEISLQNDFSELLGNVKRDEELVQEAFSLIDLPENKLKYALFWFANVTPIDDLALQYLKDGNEGKCMEILSKKDNFSSLINRATITFAFKSSQEEYAIDFVFQVIHNDKIRNDFINTIAGNTVNVTERELSHLFIDGLPLELSNFSNIYQRCSTCCEYITQDGLDYLAEKLTAEPIKELDNLISDSQKKDRKDAVARYKSGKTLMDSSKKCLPKIEQILGSNDIKYTKLVDAVAEEILNCGIDYFNNSDDEDNLEKAEVLQNYANKLAKSPILQKRCQENIETLEKLKKELPPKGVRKYDKIIQSKIVDFIQSTPTVENCISFIQDCASYIIKIKEVVEVLCYDNSYLNKISTLIAQTTLSVSIDQVNNEIKKLDAFTSKIKQFKVNYYSLPYDFRQLYENMVNKAKSVVSTSWVLLTLYIEPLPLEEDFITDRLRPNKKAIKDLINSICNGHVSTLGYTRLDLRTEKEFYEDCKSSNSFGSYNDYIRKYPNGKYLKEAVVNAEETLWNSGKWKKYLKEYPNGRYSNQAKINIEDALWNTGDWRKYLREYPNGRYSSQANKKIEAENTLWNTGNCKKYLEIYPNGHYSNQAREIIRAKKRRTVWITTIIIVVIIILILLMI